MFSHSLFTCTLLFTCHSLFDTRSGDNYFVISSLAYHLSLEFFSSSPLLLFSRTNNATSTKPPSVIFSIRFTLSPNHSPISSQLEIFVALISRQMDILALPDAFLHEMMKKVTIQDRLRIRLVCRLVSSTVCLLFHCAYHKRTYFYAHFLLFLYASDKKREKAYGLLNVAIDPDCCEIFFNVIFEI